MSWYGDAFKYVDPRPWNAGKVSRAWTDKLGITHEAPPDLSQGPDAERERSFATNVWNQYQGYQPTNAPSVDSTASDADRQRYQAALDLMNENAAGTAPSAAAAGMRRDLDANIAARLGAGSAASLPATLRAMGAGGQGVVAGAGAARGDELARSHQALFEAAQGLRGQDIGREQFQGDLLQRQIAINNAYRLGLGSLAESSLLDPYKAAIENQQRQMRNDAANQTGLGGLLKTGASLI